MKKRIHIMIDQQLYEQFMELIIRKYGKTKALGHEIENAMRLYLEQHNTQNHGKCNIFVSKRQEVIWKRIRALAIYLLTHFDNNFVLDYHEVRNIVMEVLGFSDDRTWRKYILTLTKLGFLWISQTNLKKAKYVVRHSEYGIAKLNKILKDMGLNNLIIQKEVEKYV